MSRPLKYQIPGISRILAVYPWLLPLDVLDSAEAGIPVAIPCQAFEVPFAGVPTCEVEENHKKSGVSYKTTLNFETSSEFRTHEALAWIVFDNNESATLLGIPKAPFPSMQINRQSGEFKSRTGSTVKVTCLTPPIECVYTGREILPYIIYT